MNEKIRGKLRQRTLQKELTREFANYIHKRFNVMPTATNMEVDLGMKETTEGLEWEFEETMYNAAFFMNGSGQTKFFIKLGYKKKKGLGELIFSALHSKNEIDRSSRYIGRPIRFCKDDSYIAICRLKNPKQEPKRNLYDHIFGYLMTRPLTKIHPELA
jgi:hypothetical protein